MIRHFFLLMSHQWSTSYLHFKGRFSQLCHVPHRPAYAIRAWWKRKISSNWTPMLKMLSIAITSHPWNTRSLSSIHSKRKTLLSIPYVWNSFIDRTLFYPNPFQSCWQFPPPSIILSFMMQTFITRIHWLNSWSTTPISVGTARRRSISSIGLSFNTSNKSLLLSLNMRNHCPTIVKCTSSKDMRINIIRNYLSPSAMSSHRRWASSTRPITMPLKVNDEKVWEWWTSSLIYFITGKCRRRSCSMMKTFLVDSIEISMRSLITVEETNVNPKTSGVQCFPNSTSFFSKVSWRRTEPVDLFSWSVYSLDLDGNLSQTHSHHAQVHYLFNNLLLNLTEASLDASIISAWKTLYEVSQKTNQSSYQARPHLHSALLSKGFFPFFNLNQNHQKYLLILFLSTVIIFLINICLCIIITRTRPWLPKASVQLLEQPQATESCSFIGSTASWWIVAIEYE